MLTRTRKRRCLLCPEDISNRGHNAIYCKACTAQRARDRAAIRRGTLRPKDCTTLHDYELRALAKEMFGA